MIALNCAQSLSLRVLDAPPHPSLSFYMYNQLHARAALDGLHRRLSVHADVVGFRPLLSDCHLAIRYDIVVPMFTDIPDLPVGVILCCVEPKDVVQWTVLQLLGVLAPNAQTDDFSCFLSDRKFQRFEDESSTKKGQ